MSPASAFIDTNLLVLLLVGSVDRSLVERHRRTRNFVLDDYDRLTAMVDTLEHVYVTPNTLTETSNLLHGSQDIRLMKQLKILTEQAIEVYVASQVAVNSSVFSRLGLTDAVLLESISADRPLITVDVGLYSAALAKGDKFSYNFVHWQTW